MEDYSGPPGKVIECPNCTDAFMQSDSEQGADLVQRLNSTYADTYWP